MVISRLAMVGVIVASCTTSTSASTIAEEEEAKHIDSLVTLGRIGEAHTAAMIFVQHHPSGPFSSHVMNLMGVHPRPPGAVLSRAQRVTGSNETRFAPRGRSVGSSRASPAGAATQGRRVKTRAATARREGRLGGE